MESRLVSVDDLPGVHISVGVEAGSFVVSASRGAHIELFDVLADYVEELPRVRGVYNEFILPAVYKLEGMREQYLRFLGMLARLISEYDSDAQELAAYYLPVNAQRVVVEYRVLDVPPPHEDLGREARTVLKVMKEVAAANGLFDRG